MSRKPSSRIQFEFQSFYRTTSRLKVSQHRTLCLQTISSCSRCKQWQSLESHQGRCWLTRSQYRSVLCHFFGARNPALNGAGLYSTFRVSFGCLTENQWRASPMVAAKQQFLLVHCAVVVCSDDDIGTQAVT